jgi:CBS domain-containing protein
MKVSEAIRKIPVTIDVAETMSAAAQLMDSHAVGALMVTDQGLLVGIVTDRDLVVRGIARRVDVSARIDSAMTTNPITVPADAELNDALKIFRSHAIRRLPVVHGDEIIGMLTVDDLVVDLTSSLTTLVLPVTGQVLFGSPEPATPAVVTTSP